MTLELLSACMFALTDPATDYLQGNMPTTLMRVSDEQTVVWMDTEPGTGAAEVWMLQKGRLFYHNQRTANSKPFSENRCFQDKLPRLGFYPQPEMGIHQPPQLLSCPTSAGANVHRLRFAETGELIKEEPPRTEFFNGKNVKLPRREWVLQRISLELDIRRRIVNEALRRDKVPNLVPGTIDKIKASPLPVQCDLIKNKSNYNNLKLEPDFVDGLTAKATEISRANTELNTLPPAKNQPSGIK